MKSTNSIELARHVSAMTGEMLYADVVRYASMGDHRTGSQADLETSDWIAEEMRASGFDVTLSSWPLRQFFIKECWIRVYGQTLEAFPLWFPKEIGSEPLEAELTLVSDWGKLDHVKDKVVLVEFPEIMVTLKSGHAELIMALAEAGALAILGCAPHESGEIYGQNVIPPHNQTPWPIPVLCVAPRDWHVLENAAGLGDTITAKLSGIDDIDAKAVSLFGTLNRGDDWIIISTPQSGWFRSAGERGTGVALLLGLIKWANAQSGGPSILIMSNPGHEIGHIGMHHALETFNLPTPERVQFWLHLGSSIATQSWEQKDGQCSPSGPEPESWLLCSEDLIKPLEQGFQSLPHISPKVFDLQNGEIRWILERGYSGFALMGPHRAFHLPSDGPEMTSPVLLEGIANALQQTFPYLIDREQTIPMAKKAQK